MIESNQLWEDARASYEYVVRALSELYVQLSSKDKKAIFDDDPKRMAVMFDLILSNELFQISSRAAGKLTDNETLFLQNLGTIGYDLLSFYVFYSAEQGTKIRLTWKQLQTVSAEDFKKLAAELNEAIEPIKARFFELFSDTNLLQPKNYFRRIEDGSFRIVDDYLSLDFARLEKEINDHLAIFREDFIQPIIESSADVLLALKVASDENDALRITTTARAKRQLVEEE